MEKSRETKKGLVSPANEVAADLPMLQLAKQTENKTRRHETQIKKEVQSIVFKIIEEAPNHKSDIDVNEKPIDELLKQMELSVNKTLLSGDNHSNGDDFLNPQTLSSDLTSPKKVRSHEKRSELELTSILPCQNDLDQRWANAKTREDKESVIGICNLICCFIKEKYHGDILHVRPSYDSANKNHIQFVVTTKEDSDNSQFNFQYSTVVRRPNTFSKEADEVMKSMNRSKHTISFQDSEQIKNVINSRADELLKKHRYLSVITGSDIRSKGFTQGKHQLIQEVCIVLYVQTKGKIPLDETEFPKFIDGIPVDVIEGEFQTCALAGQYQDNLCIGCKIRSNDKTAGTLGGFIEHPKYGLSAITCAHVVLEYEQIHEMQSYNGRYVLNSPTKPVYQPDMRESNNFGHVKEAIFKPGGNGEPGVDLAVVQIERRPPLNGNCPDAQSIQREYVEFETGQARSSLSETNNFVVKFGCATEETSGFVQFQYAAVKEIENRFQYQLPVGNFTYRLFNQIEIRSLSGSFADEGDSGSLVFTKNVSGEYVCIGMVVGRISSSGNGVVLPISAILSELGVNGFKDFRLNKLSAIENRLSNIENRMSNIESMLHVIAEKIN